MTRKIKRGGKVWINAYPDKSYTKKPAETRMGSGKGSPEGWVAVVKPGRVVFELAGVPEPLQEVIGFGEREKVVTHEKPGGAQRFQSGARARNAHRRVARAVPPLEQLRCPLDVRHRAQAQLKIRLKVRGPDPLVFDALLHCAHLVLLGGGDRRAVHGGACRRQVPGGDDRASGDRARLQQRLLFPGGGLAPVVRGIVLGRAGKQAEAPIGTQARVELHVHTLRRAQRVHDLADAFRQGERRGGVLLAVMDIKQVAV